MIETRYPTRTPVTRRISSRSKPDQFIRSGEPADHRQRLGGCYRHDDSPPTANDETLPRENMPVRGRSVPCPSYVTVTGTHDHACPTEKSVSDRGLTAREQHGPFRRAFERTETVPNVVAQDPTTSPALASKQPTMGNPALYGFREPSLHWCPLRLDEGPIVREKCFETTHGCYPDSEPRAGGGSLQRRGAGAQPTTSTGKEPNEASCWRRLTRSRI